MDPWMTSSIDAAWVYPLIGKPPNTLPTAKEDKKTRELKERHHNQPLVSTIELVLIWTANLKPGSISRVSSSDQYPVKERMKPVISSRTSGEIIDLQLHQAN